MIIKAKKWLDLRKKTNYKFSKEVFLPSHAQISFFKTILDSYSQQNLLSNAWSCDLKSYFL